MNKTYIVQDKIELFIFSDQSMCRQIANASDKIEILIATKNETCRFETTYNDLFTILKDADQKLSQSTKLNSN